MTRDTSKTRYMYEAFSETSLQSFNSACSAAYATFHRVRFSPSVVLLWLSVLIYCVRGVGFVKMSRVPRARVVGCNAVGIVCVRVTILESSIILFFCCVNHVVAAVPVLHR